MTTTAHFEQRADVLAYIVTTRGFARAGIRRPTTRQEWAMTKGKATLDGPSAPTFSDSEWDTFGEMVKTRIEETR
jgi:hypothetical protein